MAEKITKTWSNYDFERMCPICPQKNDEGNIQELMPQSRYSNTSGLQLHQYGKGPFCKFVIMSNWRFEGVYLLTIEHAAMYVGECVDLSSRFNSGYGNISPRNCYSNGQPTNCRINNLIYIAAKAEQNIELWFCKTNDRKSVECDLISALSPRWNRKGIRR